MDYTDSPGGQHAMEAAAWEQDQEDRVDHELGLNWSQDTDDDGNLFWEAASPYHDEGTPFMWRIKKWIGDGVELFYPAHTEELMEPFRGKTYRTLPDALEAVRDEQRKIVHAED